jgi:hypothetical protein
MELSCAGDITSVESLVNTALKLKEQVKQEGRQMSVRSDVTSKRSFEILHKPLASVWPYCRHRRITENTKVSFRFVSQCFPLLPVHSRCRGCLFSLDHTQTHTTVGRTPPDEGSARRRDLYLTTQTLKRDKDPCPRWDSNPWSQQAVGRRPTP